MNFKNIMKLPELNLLTLTREATFYKLVEEMAECNDAIDILNKHGLSAMKLKSEIEETQYRIDSETKIYDVLGEVMDVAQVCSSQLFVLEDEGTDVKSLLNIYKENLEDSPILETVNNFRYIYFSQTSEYTSLEDTMNEIISSIGKIAQLSKFTGANGEKVTINKEESTKKYIWYLLDVMRSCFKLLYSINKTYGIDIQKIFDEHVAKLERRGYCKI